MNLRGKMKYTELLSINGFYVVNKQLIQLLQCSDASLILSYLCYRANLWEEQDGNSDGWFYCTYDFIERDLGIKRRKQMTAIKLLESRGLIETQNKGLPSKRHFRIGDLSVLISEQSSSYNSYELNSTKCTNNSVQNVRQYNKDIINYNNKEYTKEEFFNYFYSQYPVKTHKKYALRTWLKLSVENMIKAVEGITTFTKGKELKYIKNPQAYLNGEHWNDEPLILEPEKPKGFVSREYVPKASK